MKIKRIPLLLAAVVATFCLAGCQSDTESSQAEQTSVEIQQTGAIEQNEELNVDTDTSPETSSQKEENHITTEFEITEYSFEDVISDFEIDDIIISLPCSFEELNKNFNLEDKYCFYDIDQEKNCFSYNVEYTDKIHIIIDYYSDMSDENKLTADEMFCFYIRVYGGYNDVGLFRFGKINNSMTRDDVEKTLGESNVDIYVNSWYVFDDYKTITINYDQNGYINCINCFWNR